MPVYAAFWKRLVAFLLDNFIYTLVTYPIAFVIGLAFGTLMGNAGIDPKSDSWTVIMVGFKLSLFVLAVILKWLYFAFMESSSLQGTVGKLSVEIKVVTLSGERVSFTQATGRFFAKYLSALTCFIGYLMVLFTEKKQGLHDILAGTLVVNKY